MDESRRLEFETPPRHDSTAYLTASWQPPTARRRWLRDAFLTKAGTRAAERELDTDLVLFQAGIERLTDLLRGVLLGVEPLDAHGTATYLHHVTSWERHQVRCPASRVDLDWQMASGTWLPGQRRSVDGQWVQPLTVASWQQDLSTWLPEALATLPFPCRYQVRWAPMDTAAADSHLRWMEKAWAGSYDRLSGFVKKSGGLQKAGPERRDVWTEAVQAGDSILDVQEEVLTGDEVVGMLSPTVLCWAPTVELLEERVRRLQAVLFQHGLVARVDTAGASTGVALQSLPGHVGLWTQCLSTSYPGTDGPDPA